jgi:hypothetical protein
MKKTGKFMFFLSIVLLLLLYLSQHRRVESFVIGQLRKKVQEDSASCSTEGTVGCSSAKSISTNQCSYITDPTKCNSAYMGNTVDKVKCSWVDGIYDLNTKTCKKNTNGEGGVCESC